MKHLWIMLVVVLMVGCEEKRNRLDGCWIEKRSGEKMEITLENLAKDYCELSNEVRQLRQLLKQKPEYCELCGERIIEKHWLDNNGELRILSWNDLLDGIFVREEVGGDTIGFKWAYTYEASDKAIPICEKCAKRNMGWLAKQYYERRCGK